MTTVKEFNGYAFKPFTEADVAGFTRIMKRAFDEDARRHLGEPEGGPPGYDTGEFLRKYALDPASTAYTCWKGEVPVGAVIVWIHRNRENFLGNMFVDPEFQDKGTGTLIWKFIESAFPDTKVWRTETPGFSKRNHNFYVNKCGFKVVRIENPGDKYEESYCLEKMMRPK